MLKSIILTVYRRYIPSPYKDLIIIKHICIHSNSFQFPIPSSILQLVDFASTAKTAFSDHVWAKKKRSSNGGCLLIEVEMYGIAVEPPVGQVQVVFE
jgi:hypothetical protein